MAEFDESYLGEVELADGLSSLPSLLRVKINSFWDGVFSLRHSVKTKQELRKENFSVGSVLGSFSLTDRISQNVFSTLETFYLMRKLLVLTS